MMSVKNDSEIPADLASHLAGNAAAAEKFKNLSPSHRREYIVWINGAKREETRLKRLAATLERLTGG